MKPSEALKMYEGYLRLDGVDIGEALIQQPQCYYEVCSILADYRRSLKDCRTSLHRVEGKAALKHRKIFEKRGIKPTDGYVQAKVDSDDAVIDARKKYNKLYSKVEHVEGLKEAYIQRSFAMKELVTLLPDGQYVPNSISKSDSKQRKHKSKRKLRSL